MIETIENVCLLVIVGIVGMIIGMLIEFVVEGSANKVKVIEIKDETRKEESDFFKPF